MSGTWLEQSPGRYDRHHLIGWWEQERVAAARVLVAGAGALGNEVIKNLALIGVGTIWIVDFDTVDVTNLTRSVLFRESDVGRSKAEVAAAQARSINPQADVHALNGDLELDLGLGRLRQFDLVFGCLDSLNARWALNRACRRAGVPWINAGIGAAGGEVSFFAPDHPVCFECAMTREMWVQFNERYSCTKLLKTLPEGAQPTTATTASVMAALQVQQALVHLHGLQVADGLGPGQRLFFQFKPYHFTISDLPHDPECLAHESMTDTVAVTGSVARLTPADLFAAVEAQGAATLVLGFDLATALECPTCGTSEVLRPVKKLRPADATCPVCSGQRAPRLVSEVEAGDPLAQRTLVELGVPQQPILKVRSGDAVVYVEVVEPEGGARR